MNSEKLGYSLTELVVILSLIALFASIAIPNSIAMLDSYRLSIAAHSIANEMQHARLLAVTRSSQIKLRFNVAARSYRLIESGTGPISFPKYLPRGVRFLSVPRADINFHSRGNTVPAGSVVVKNTSGAVRVIVNPGGRIRQEPYRE